MGAGGLRRGVPSLNVIGQIDLPRNLDSLLIDADMVVAGPAIVLHGIKDLMVPRETIIRISGSLPKKHSELI